MEKDNKYTKFGDKRFTLRMNEKLYNELVEDANINGRATCRHIEFIIEQYLKGRANEEQQTKKP